jgi:hypothetical protein
MTSRVEFTLPYESSNHYFYEPLTFVLLSKGRTSSERSRLQTNWTPVTWPCTFRGRVYWRIKSVNQSNCIFCALQETEDKRPTMSPSDATFSGSAKFAGRIWIQR